MPRLKSRMCEFHPCWSGPQSSHWNVSFTFYLFYKINKTIKFIICGFANLPLANTQIFGQMFASNTKQFLLHHICVCASRIWKSRKQIGNTLDQTLEKEETCISLILVQIFVSKSIIYLNIAFKRLYYFNTVWTICNKLTKLGDAIAISNMKLWRTDWLTGVGAGRCYHI